MNPPPPSGGIIPCFGVGCPIHEKCKRYALIELSSPWQSRLGFCGKGEGERPLFLPIIVEPLRGKENRK